MEEEIRQDRPEIRQGVEGFNTARKGGRSADTPNTRTKTRTIPRRIRGTGTGTETKKEVDEKELLVLEKEPDVKVYEPKHSDHKATVPPPKQGQPKAVELNITEPNPVEQKTTKTTPTQTKKRTTRKKKSGVDMTQFDAMIIGFSEYIASRPNMAHWKMTEKEVQSITEPLGNIIAKSDMAGQLAEHSDAIALVLACGMVFIPRITISAQMAKTKKEAKKTGFKLTKEVKKDEPVRDEKTEDGISLGTDDGKHHHSDHVPSPHSDLSFIGSGLPVL